MYVCVCCAWTLQVVVFFSGLVWSLVDSQGLPDVGTVMEQLNNVPVLTAVVWTGLVTTALTVMLQTTSLGVLSRCDAGTAWGRGVRFSAEGVLGLCRARAGVGHAQA